MTSPGECGSGCVDNTRNLEASSSMQKSRCGLELAETAGGMPNGTASRPWDTLERVLAGLVDGLRNCGHLWFSVARKSSKMLINICYRGASSTLMQDIANRYARNPYFYFVHH